MKRIVALCLLLAGAAAPLAAQPHGAQPNPGQSLEATVEHAAGQPQGEASDHSSEKFDAMHHVMDGRTIEFKPFAEIHLPPEHSWQVGPIDFTPTRHTVFLALAGLLVIAVFVPAGMAARRRRNSDVPRGRHNAVEALALYFRDQVVMPNIGHGGEKFAPFLLTLFFFILFTNLLGMVPFGSTATANIAVTAGLAIVVFVVIEIAGMAALGPKGYLGTIVYVPHGLPKPLIPIMALIMTPVEVIGKLSKPFALAVRLMANMMAGHIVLYSLFGVAIAFGGVVVLGPGLMAFALTFLEIFVSFLQAYVFTVLSSVFIGMIRHAH